ncbi:MAG: hypothetical protein WA091_02825 [Minisyncoccales bacterium]
MVITSKMMTEVWNISEAEIKEAEKELYGTTDNISESGEYRALRRVANKKIKRWVTYIELGKITVALIPALIMYFFLSPYQIIPTLIFFVLGYLFGLMIEPYHYRHNKFMFMDIGKAGIDYVEAYYWGWDPD